MTWDALVALLTNGGALAWLAWEIRQLRSEVTSDIDDLRARVRRIESRCLPDRACEEAMT